MAHYLVFDVVCHPFFVGFRYSGIARTNSRPMALARRGGTAFATCLICAVMLPENRIRSGKDWRRANSLIDAYLSLNGWKGVQKLAK